jgi:hypothetical protein
MLRTLTASAASTSRLIRLRMADAAAAGAGAPAAGLKTEARITELGYKLPTPAKSVANYVMCKRVGNMIYTGG